MGGPIPAGHIHRPVLAPLRPPEVIGVAELVNKINGPWFSKFDEDLATAFSIYCGISIAHVSGDRGGAVQDPLFFSPLWLSLLCPDGSVPRPGTLSPAAGLLCKLQYPLVTSSLSFPSENWDAISCPVQLASQDHVETQLSFFTPSLEATSTQAPAQLLFGKCWVSLSGAGSSAGESNP